MTTAVADTSAARRATAPATVAQTPWWLGSSVPTRGMNGQKSLRPHRASAAGMTTITLTRTTTTPTALVQPMVRRLPLTASSRVRRESVTVTALPTMAPPADDTAPRRATR